MMRLLSNEQRSTIASRMLKHLTSQAEAVLYFFYSLSQTYRISITYYTLNLTELIKQNGLRQHVMQCSVVYQTTTLPRNKYI